jgi:predicted aspartyl protease
MQLALDIMRLQIHPISCVKQSNRQSQAGNDLIFTCESKPIGACEHRNSRAFSRSFRIVHSTTRFQPDMQISVIHGSKRITMDVDTTMQVQDLLVLVACEFDVDLDTVDVTFNGIDLKKVQASTLAHIGMASHQQSPVTVSSRQSQPVAAAPPSPLANNPMLRGLVESLGSITPMSPAQLARHKASQFIEQIRGNPYVFSTLKQNHPRLADAVQAGDLDLVAKFLHESDETQRQQKARIDAARRTLAANPYDVDAQRIIEEQIELENIEASRQQAMEHLPESFAPVVMLYINVKVNGFNIKAFVDSGAQMTIMSLKCAQRCNLSRLIDKRFQGLAVGVGTQKIVGRVHMCQLEIAGSFLPTSFSVLEEQPMDMLLGLDMLKRHQCILDLKRNRLEIGSAQVSTPFLSEAELPPNARHLSMSLSFSFLIRVTLCPNASRPPANVIPNMRFRSTKQRSERRTPSSSTLDASSNECSCPTCIKSIGFSG